MILLFEQKKIIEKNGQKHRSQIYIYQTAKGVIIKSQTLVPCIHHQIYFIFYYSQFVVRQERKILIILKNHRLQIITCQNFKIILLIFYCYESSLISKSNLIKSQQTNNFRDLGDLLSSLLIKSSKYDHHIQIVLNKCQSLCRISTNTMTGAANNLITIINISFFQFYLSDKCLILIIENLILVIVSSLISCMYRLAIRSRTDNIPHNQIFQLFKQYLSETELRSTSLQMTQSRGFFKKCIEFSEMGNCF
ncbi:hypothetical protein pb186bvf_011149 [Paramecium bursaria]